VRSELVSCNCPVFGVFSLAHIASVNDKLVSCVLLSGTAGSAVSHGSHMAHHMSGCMYTTTRRIRVLKGSGVSFMKLLGTGRYLCTVHTYACVWTRAGLRTQTGDWARMHQHIGVWAREYMTCAHAKLPHSAMYGHTHIHW
jgi:hypothetical protein